MFSGDLVFKELSKRGVWEQIKSLGCRGKAAVETDDAVVGVCVPGSWSSSMLPQR